MSRTTTRVMLGDPDPPRTLRSREYTNSAIPVRQAAQELTKIDYYI
jgi:hypothetical protein